MTEKTENLIEELDAQFFHCPYINGKCLGRGCMMWIPEPNYETVVQAKMPEGDRWSCSVVEKIVPDERPNILDQKIANRLNDYIGRKMDGWSPTSRHWLTERPRKEDVVTAVQFLISEFYDDLLERQKGAERIIYNITWSRKISPTHGRCGLVIP